MAYLSPDLVQKALSITSGYKNGGTVAPMKRAASALEKAGRKGDTELVHVTPGELSLLETIGSGTTNPVTGLREFFRGDQQSKDVEGRDSQEADGPPGSGMGPGDTAATTGGDVGDRSERGGGDGRDVEDALAEALRDPNVDLNEALDTVLGPEGTDLGDAADTSGAAGVMPSGPEGTDLGDAASIAAGAAAVPPRDGRDKEGIAGAIQNVLDRNKDGKISAGEAAFGIASVATPIGPMMALGKGLENLVTGIQFGTELGSDQTGMIAEQQRGLYGDEEEERDSGDREEREAEVEEVPEELTVEALTRPPTIDIVPFRPQDFYYFTPGSFAYNRGIPSMMNMRRG